jgi:2-polyprenyl-3-methyl-5-hydroxy-6-metoxy-1,4-benzoquinol methylase
MSDGYVLGHSERELARLAEQARLIGPITRHILERAGIVRGMRVLDVGSGVGDVAFLVADLVGREGEVVGYDRVGKALEVARRRASERGMANVSFREGDPAQEEVGVLFDAVVGRYVLMFQPDPVAVLRGVARHARPGGIVAFHEIDWDGARSSPPAPTFDASCRFIAEVVARSGASTRMGMHLHATFLAAGLPCPMMHLEAQIEGAVASLDLVRLTSDLAISLLPEMERFGVTTAAELAPETLEERMIAEIVAGRGAVTGRSEIGAWARTASS